MSEKPKANSSVQKEIAKAQEQFDKFDADVKEMTMDRMNASPREEVEQQTKISTREAQNSKDIYLKPLKSIGCRAKFNERFRDEYNFAKEYVKIIAEHREIIGEELEIWTKKFPGVPYEFWKVPVNKPIWVPRYLAEQIKGCSYHRLSMDERAQTGTDGTGTWYGRLVVDNTVQRLDAIPVSTRRSIFMGGAGF